jgi:hypothetical protein
MWKPEVFLDTGKMSQLWWNNNHTIKTGKSKIHTKSENEKQKSSHLFDGCYTLFEGAYGRRWSIDVVKVTIFSLVTAFMQLK